MANSSNVIAVVLCGGLGTRLRSITEDQVPKPMVDVAGRPFLEYLLDYLIEQGVSKAVLAISYRKELIISHFGNHYKNLEIDYSIEDEPLGTGGAIKQAIRQNTTDDTDFALVLNGDTFVEYHLDKMIDTARETNSKLVMALKPLDNTDRYGRVTVNDNNKIIAFEEKKSGESGHINAGVYLISMTLLDQFPAAAKFSFETDFLEKQIADYDLYASYFDGYFIDIGIPEDYYLAQTDFQKYT